MAPRGPDLLSRPRSSSVATVVVVSLVSGYVIVWEELRADLRVFAPGSVVDPGALVGSVVSSRFNYHQPVGLVTDAVNDAVGCLVTVQLDFGKGRDRTLTLVPAYVAKEAVQHEGGLVRVNRAFLLHVSLGASMAG